MRLASIALLNSAGLGVFFDSHRHLGLGVDAAEFRTLAERERETSTPPEDPFSGIVAGIDVPGQTVLFCTEGLDCPENPNLWKFDNIDNPLEIDPRTLNPTLYGPTRGEGKPYPPFWGFSQDTNQYFFANYNELVPTKTISRRDSNGLPGLKKHPDADKFWDEIKGIEVPVPPLIDPTGRVLADFSSMPLTVEDILTNSERDVFEPPGLSPGDFNYKIKDIFPTDGLIILYEGMIVYENYFSFTENTEAEEHTRTFDQYTRHRSFSVSKSFAGTMVKMLEKDLKGTDKEFTVDDKIVDILPLSTDLKKPSAWQDVTIQMVLDMTSSINAEEYEDCPILSGNFTDYMRAIAAAPRDEYGYIDKTEIEVPDQCQSRHFYRSVGTTSPGFAPWFNEAYFSPPFSDVMMSPLRYNQVSDYASIGVRRALQAVEKGNREHGERFEYNSIITNMLGWLIEHLTDYNSAEFFSKRIWSKMGAESDASIAMDDLRFPLWDGFGFSGTLRDLARFGELTRNNGKVIDNLGTCEKVVEEVIAESIVLDSKSNGDFTKAKLTRGVPAGVINCMLNPGSSEILVHDIQTNETKKCSEIANAPPLNNWLKAIGKCDQDQDECNNDTGLHFAYRNQFWAIVDDNQEGEQKPGGLIFQEGVRGQAVWTFDDAKLVIARVGSNAATTNSYSLYEYAAALGGGSSVDFALWRTFYEIAAHFINEQKKSPNNGKSGKSGNSKKSRKSC